MSDNIEYIFRGGENTTSVDRQKETITMYERGGWERSYTLKFKELLQYAKQWDVKIDINDSDKIIAEIATNIILANNAAEHNLDPFRYVPRTNKITDPRDMATLNNFEALFNKYNTEQIISAMTEETKRILKEALIK